MLICGVTKDITDRFHAGDIIKALSAKVGGTGGGRPDMAQGGGPHSKKIKEALESLLEILAS
jgi:alanyl-tRNA synthetase